MNPRLLVSLTALLLCPVGAAVAQTAPASPAAPPAAVSTPAPARVRAGQANRVQGRVTAIDTAKRTFTVDPRGAAAPVTVSLASDARFLLSGIGTAASLNVGDHVAAYGTATPDAPTLLADRIAVLPAQTVRASKGAPKRNAGFHPKRVEGTITTVTPALTLTTPGGVLVTVTLAPTARVETMTPGSLADMTVGQTVDARVAGDPAAPIASEVRILPARAHAARGKKRGARVGAPLATTPLTTPGTP